MFEPVFTNEWSRTGGASNILIGDIEVFGGATDQVGFIARAEMDVPVDGYVKLTVTCREAHARLYIDGELVIDLWMDEDVYKSATVKVEAGKHSLELWWYKWGGTLISASFETDRRIMAIERHSDPFIGSGIACTGAALMTVARIKSSKSEKP